MTRNQLIAAADQFRQVLTEASNAGILDGINGEMHPDKINAVCDGVNELAALPNNNEPLPPGPGLLPRQAPADYRENGGPDSDFGA